MHTIDYIKHLKDAKFNDEQITAIVIIVTDLEDKQKNETATNQVLKIDLVNLKFELIKWMVGIGVGGILAIAGLLKFIIH